MNDDLYDKYQKWLIARIKEYIPVRMTEEFGGEFKT
jgi:hypothetical protein